MDNNNPQDDPNHPNQFNNSIRYVDDLLTINNDGLMKKHMNKIYPKELELKHQNSYSYRSPSDAINTVAGQVIGCIDRCLHADLSASIERGLVGRRHVEA